MEQLIKQPVAEREVAVSDWLGSAYLPSGASVRRFVFRASAVVIVIGWVREFFRVILGIGAEGTSFFNLNGEQNLGAWYSATMLAVCAFVLLTAGRRARAEMRPWGWFWFVLSLTFAAMSIDEASSIHEMFMNVIKEHWHTAGPFTYAWVIPALVMVPAFGLCSVPFLLSLPRRTAVWFVVSGAIYVSGALGCEMIEGMLDPNGAPFVLTYLIEESLEIIGFSSFFFAIIDHLERGYRARPER